MNYPERARDPPGSATAAPARPPRGSKVNTRRTIRARTYHRTASRFTLRPSGSQRSQPPHRGRLRGGRGVGGTMRNVLSLPRITAAAGLAAAVLLAGQAAAGAGTGGPGGRSGGSSFGPGHWSRVTAL